MSEAEAGWPIGTRKVVEHPVRLEILAGLDGEPLTLQHLARRVGRDERHVAFHLQVLESFGLVEEAGDEEEGKAAIGGRRRRVRRP